MTDGVAEEITCPRCGKTSWNLNDVRHRYCGNCRQFHDDMRAMKPLEPIPDPVGANELVNVRVVLADPRLAPLPKTMLVRLAKNVADALEPGCKIRLATEVDVAIESFLVYPLVGREWEKPLE